MLSGLHVGIDTRPSWGFVCFLAFPGSGVAMRWDLTLWQSSSRILQRLRLWPMPCIGRRRRNVCVHPSWFVPCWIWVAVVENSFVRLCAARWTWESTLPFRASLDTGVLRHTTSTPSEDYKCVRNLTASEPGLQWVHRCVPALSGTGGTSSFAVASAVEARH